MYWGEYVRGRALPWHFLPVWMVITIPVGYLLLFGVGVMRVLIDSLNVPRMVHSTKQREGLVYLLLLVVPVLFAIVNNITLYSGWRHFTFVYAPFLMVALYGVRTLVQGGMRLPSLYRRWVGALLGAVLLLYQLFQIKDKAERW